MEMEVLISIIIPIYNVGPYITACVQSIASQTYRNIEIICVDDGSTDESANLVDALAIKDDRIRVYRKENGGQSSARNYGIEKAKGEYIHFVDSDDMLSPYTIESLYLACLKTQSKLSVCKFTKRKDNLESFISEKYELIQGTFIDLVQGVNRTGFPTVSACMKLYHASLFADYRFPEGMIYEDAASYLYILDQIEQYVLCDLFGYYYRTNETSTTTKQITDKNFDILKSNQLQIELCEHKHPDALPLIYRHCLNNNDFVAMNCVIDNGPLAKELFKLILSANRNYAKHVKIRGWIYQFGPCYRVALKIMSKFYYNDTFRNKMKKIMG